jgi:transcriptional regulator with XRE-family HTH domain
MDTIGQRVKDRRKALGMNRQQDLADAVGVNQSVISDIERGAGFGARYVMALAKALKWSPEQLLDGKTGSPVPMTDKMHELLAECESLTDEDMAALIRVAQGMRHVPKAMPGVPPKRKSA